MSESKTPTKRDLKILRFEVISEESANEPLCEGDYNDILDYLTKRKVEGLKVIAVDVDSWSTMDPIPAKDFIKWYQLIVKPQLKEASYNSEVDIYFPNTQLELVGDDAM